MNKVLGLLLLLFPLSASAEAAAVQLVDLSGRPVAFSEVQRDATLVAFWMTTCAPCIEEMPLLDALYKKESGSGSVAVVGVNLDEDDKLAAAKKIVAARKVSYPMLRDPKFSLIRKWFPKYPEETGLPIVLVLDRQSHALYSQGFMPGTTAETFIAEWSPRLADARTGKLREPLQRIFPKKGATTDPAQMAKMVDKIVRSHHPELSDEEVKKRVDAAMKQFIDTGRFEIK